MCLFSGGVSSDNGGWYVTDPVTQIAPVTRVFTALLTKMHFMNLLVWLRLDGTAVHSWWRLLSSKRRVHVLDGKDASTTVTLVPERRTLIFTYYINRKDDD